MVVDAKSKRRKGAFICEDKSKCGCIAFEDKKHELLHINTYYGVDAPYNRDIEPNSIHNNKQYDCVDGSVGHSKCKVYDIVYVYKIVFINFCATQTKTKKMQIACMTSTTSKEILYGSDMTEKKVL